MDIKRHLFTIVILIDWFELVLLSGRLPHLSVQLEMIRTVTVTFLKIMKGYVLLLVALALAFYILFQIVSIWSPVTAPVCPRGLQEF
jgi:hypothetical protein